ncbi:glutaminyl-peptide cyclotransferase [Corynebacterium sp. H78]|uniref:glutaminyl-peptide cyclotransferase n=1 Tax=Corynebacterium sp. H78 TaxID=3133417 RepID=UPI0030A69D33
MNLQTLVAPAGMSSHFRVNKRTLFACLALATSTTAMTSCGDADDSSAADDPLPGQPTQFDVRIVAKHPSDPRAFTQGLELDKDFNLVVGTGMYNESEIYRVKNWPSNGATPGTKSEQHKLEPGLFGEGITIADDTVWQLTWRENVAIARDVATLQEQRRVRYDGEGWGICAFQDKLVMSDGSGHLQFRDPDTFGVTGGVDVTNGETPATALNELECVQGSRGPEVWANVWQTNTILRIDPATGHVTGEADATELVNQLPTEARARADVLNGIADYRGTGTFLVTGKYWPTLYQVEFVPRQKR